MGDRALERRTPQRSADVARAAGARFPRQLRDGAALPQPAACSPGECKTSPFACPARTAARGGAETGAWLVLRRPEHRDAEDQALLAGLREHSCVLDEAIELAEAFAALVRGREPARLDPWRQRAQNGALPSLRRFA